MKRSQIAAQLFTLRDFLKTPQDIQATLTKVRAIGYEAVQVSGMGPIEESELVRMLEGEGLVCCATHEPSATIVDNPNAVVERLQKLGCKHTAYPHPHLPFTTEEELATMTGHLDRAGKVLHDAGLVLSYHNHSLEFCRVSGHLVLEYIYKHTDPRYLQAELDTYWVQHGGGDVADWCRKFAGRSPLIHLKDYTINAERQPFFAEIGHGNLNWPEILPAAEEAGCEWFIVEQDRCERDPFESLKMSYEFLTGNYCS